MARVERYFPVAQDINGDPETWVLTDTFGDRSLRVWLEILSITDRLENHWRMVDGWLANLSRKVRQSPATVSRVVGWLLAKEWLIVHERSADGSPLVVGTRNYSKFHRTRETVRQEAVAKLALSEPTDPILTRPILPNHPKKDDYKIPHSRQNPKTPYPENFQITDQLREWCNAQRFADPDAHLEAFRDYHIAKGSRFIDWSAAFRTWLRNSGRFGQPAQKQKEGELSERTMRILRRGL